MKLILFELCIILSILVTSCSNEPSHVAQGYIEGRYTYMATNVSGVLNKIWVARGTKVKKGQILYELEQQPESDVEKAAQANLQQAIANKSVINANLAFAKITFERNKILVPQNAIQQSELDRAKAAYDANVAQLDQANENINSLTATLKQAEWMLAQKVGYAPVDAIVFDTYYRLGEYTEANKPILSLLAPTDIKAIFYVAEPSLSKIKLGDRVIVNCDQCQKSYSGRISFISPTAEYTPPLIYSTDTNYKLIFRIEAEFAPEDGIHLHPGQPIYVKYLHEK